jgi:hypothetical protein
MRSGDLGGHSSSVTFVALGLAPPRFKQPFLRGSPYENENCLITAVKSHNSGGETRASLLWVTGSLPGGFMYIHGRRRWLFFIFLDFLLLIVVPPFLRIYSIPLPLHRGVRQLWLGSTLSHPQSVWRSLSELALGWVQSEVVQVYHFRESIFGGRYPSYVVCPLHTFVRVILFQICNRSIAIQFQPHGKHTVLHNKDKTS